MPSYEFDCLLCQKRCHYQNDYTSDVKMQIVCNECADSRFTEIIAHQSRACRFCGQGQLYGHYGTVYRRMAVEMLQWACCTKCHFYLDLLAKYRGKYPAVIVDGEHRVDAGNAPGARTSDLGYGGDVWEFRMLDNPKQVITTNNMWNQGTIPPYLRRLLPDNAAFTERHSHA